MQYYYIEPEVSGGFGENSIVDYSVHPPTVSKLDYEFSGWLGDDLLESFPCFIVTKKLADILVSSNLTGYKLGEVEVSVSETYKELYPSKKLPNFLWLIVDGDKGKADFFIAEDYRLVVSQLALDVLNTMNMDQADIEEY